MVFTSSSSRRGHPSPSKPKRIAIPQGIRDPTPIAHFQAPISFFVLPRFVVAISTSHGTASDFILRSIYSSYTSLPAIHAGHRDPYLIQACDKHFELHTTYEPETLTASWTCLNSSVPLYLAARSSATCPPSLPTSGSYPVTFAPRSESYADSIRL